MNLPGREYEIVIGGGLLRESGGLLREGYSGGTVFAVTDEHVAPLYLETFTRSLEGRGMRTVPVVIPPGEESKSLACLETVYGALLKEEITRGHLIAALGGGVVGDLAGYAAATLLRGIPFVQVPTTLLAQVDSSVGGKVAVNHPRGKNLIGAFHQPKLVIADTDTLDTLSPRVFADGMGEVVKHGAIADEEMFALLENGAFDREDVIYRNCGIKSRVVEGDEFDTGGRMILNFGHTFGHAIEAAGGFSRYTHGEAVAMGMVMAAELGERLDITVPGTAERLRRVLTMYNLPVKPDLEVDFRFMLTDKKRDGDILRLILLKKIGEAVIVPVAVSELGALI
ncbi:MAG: 3-dehydroquinate synthase [Oscillospiraceae bacterium]|nr:3-dehydroquinate synthase [Oscillospiraceae bacterium]